MNCWATSAEDASRRVTENGTSELAILYCGGVWSSLWGCQEGDCGTDLAGRRGLANSGVVLRYSQFLCCCGSPVLPYLQNHSCLFFGHCTLHTASLFLFYFICASGRKGRFACDCDSNFLGRNWHSANFQKKLIQQRKMERTFCSHFSIIVT